MKIGNIQFPDRPLFLAPMEDVTDIGFRMLCKRFGAQMVYTEFVSAEALIRSIKSTVNKLNIADEESKWGVSKDEVSGLIDQIASECPNVRIKGLMTVVPYADDPEEIRGYFAEVKEMYDGYAGDDREMVDFEYLSMGMTHDYVTAMEEGSNLIRVGTGIFGTRVY